MNYFTTLSFWKNYNLLSQSTQKLADKNYELLKQNPKHPSLHYKKIDKYWSVRVGIYYRGLAIEIEEGILWFWIGTHTDYEKLIK